MPDLPSRRHCFAERKSEAHTVATPISKLRTPALIFSSLYSCRLLLCGMVAAVLTLPAFIAAGMCQRSRYRVTFFLRHGVSTGSGSDRVTVAISILAISCDPVATAPGTDLILKLRHPKG